MPGSAIARRKRGDAAVVAAQLEDLLDHGAVLALELAGASVDGHLVGTLLDLDAKLAVGPVWAAPARPRCSPWSATARAAAGEADLLSDLGDRADLEELVLVAGDEEDALVVADVDRERDAPCSGTRRCRRAG